MWPKYLAQLVVVGLQVVGRAFARAVREEFQTGRQAAAKQGGESRRNAAINVKHGMTLQEAVQILNIRPEAFNPEEIRKKYEHLYAVNEKSKGGSLYLQAKIASAKERVDEELKLQSKSESKDSS